MLLKAIFGEGKKSRLATKHGPYRVSEVPGNFWSSGNRSAAGVDVDADSALSLSGVFAAVNILSRVHGMIPIHVMRQLGRTREKATSHPAYRLLHTRPNPRMSASVFKRVMEWNRLMFGGAYAQIVWAGNGKPAAFWPIEGWRIKPSETEDGVFVYLLDGKQEIQPEDILAIPGTTPDGVSCTSFIEYAIQSLGLGISAQEFAGRLFGQGAKPGGVLKHSGTPTLTARQEMRESWESIHGGPENAGKTAVIWGGWEYVAEDGTFAPEQAQLLETRRFTTEEVSRWIDNIPPHMIGDLSRATFSNIEEQGLNAIIYTLMPTYVQYEQEVDEKLLSPPYTYCKYNVNALARGSMSVRVGFYGTMVGMGAMSLNEVRDLEDMNPIDGGDVHWIPNNNMVPITQAIGGMGGGPAAPPAQQQPQPATEPQPAPAPAPQPTLSEPPQIGAASIEAKRALLASVLERMAKVEANALRRAAEKPDKFMDWAVEFYDSHHLKLADALLPVLPVVSPGISPAALASQWCVQSREDVLTACEVPPTRLVASIDMMLRTWAYRAKGFAETTEVQ